MTTGGPEHDGARQARRTLQARLTRRTVLHAAGPLAALASLGGAGAALATGTKLTQDSSLSPTTSRRGHGSAATQLPAATDLRLHVRQAAQAGHGLVVMVSLQGCAYCHVVRHDHLWPSWQEGRLRVVQVDMRSTAALLDEDGQHTTHDAWVRARDIRIAPTLVFLDAQGREAAPRLEGAGLADFYGAYLDQRVQAIRPAVSR